MVTEALYDATGGHPCLDFVNTVDRTVDRPWVDRLRTYADLLDWSQAAGTLPEGVADLAGSARSRPAAAEAALVRSRDLREAVYRIFAALAAGAEPADADLARLNAELAQALSHLRVEPRDGGFDWSFDADPPAFELPIWPIVRAAAELLTSGDRALVKRCAGETCLWLFLDRTKNHARRWCDMKVCGNRAKVRRHRGRAGAGG